MATTGDLGVGLAVYRAAKEGNVAEARHLILDHVARRGSIATFSATDQHGNCPLDLWASTGRRELLDVLEPLGIDWSPYTAIAWGRTETVQQLFRTDPAVLTRERWIGNPLHWALYFDRTGLARWLLDRGIDVSSTEGRVGYVRAATFGRHAGAIRFASEMGADVDHGSQTALHHECKHGWARFVPLLIDLGANPNRPDRRGRTPLHLAAKRGTSRALIKLLVERGADPARRDAKGETPLDLAARARRPCAADYLRSIGT